jgi:2-amino-4-hydroxy-6-hydroxymethyldihydropteridine diphosphokinase
MLPVSWKDKHISLTRYYAKQSTKICKGPDDFHRSAARIPRTTFAVVIVHIATGSNLGTRIDQLDRADDELSRLGRVLRVSPTYETAAVGMAHGTPDFLNRVVEVELDPVWAENPEGTMQALLDIEREMGRTRVAGAVRSRPIDLDIVLWGDRTLDLPGLLVPHPRMLGRRFVLQPLADLVPDAPVPGTDRSVLDHLRGLPVDVPDIASWPTA